MSWAEVAPLKTESGDRRGAPVEFKVCRRPGPRKPLQRVAVVVVREKLFKDLPSWLRPGAGVKVLRGTGQHFGQLRVMPDGPIVVSKIGGRYASKVILVRMPLWAGLPDAENGAPVTFRLSSESLEIDLPAWSAVG
jgi:hypothetical protein